MERKGSYKACLEEKALLTLLKASNTEERREPPTQASLLCPPNTDLLRCGLGAPAGRWRPSPPDRALSPPAKPPAKPATMPCVSSAIIWARLSTAAAWRAGWCLDLARRAARRPATTGPPGWISGGRDVWKETFTVCVSAGEKCFIDFEKCFRLQGVAEVWALGCVA